MQIWRAYFLKHQRLAFLLVAMALLAKAIVPQGFMVMPSNGTVMVSLCSGQGPQMVAMDLGKGTVDHGGDHQDGTNTHPPCAFSGLNMAAAPGADLVLLGLAIAYVLALGFLPVVSRAQPAPSRLRPPLRAPPVFG
ncbi:MAG: hypothetical protein C0474_00740 [Sphingobium sp.]|nr:hypothetical protein [Sphingobium sp.]